MVIYAHNLIGRIGAHNLTGQIGAHNLTGRFGDTNLIVFICHVQLLCLYFNVKTNNKQQVTFLQYWYWILQKTGGTFQLHEFPITAAWILDFNFTNSRFKIHEFNSVNSWSWNRDFMKLKSWIHKVEFVNSRSWIREVEIVNSWIPYVGNGNEVEMALPYRSFVALFTDYFATFGTHCYFKRVLLVLQYRGSTLIYIKYWNR
jgi:hypothetical protein